MWRKLLKEIIILFRVAIWAGLGFLMWKGSRQPSWALVRKEDVRMWEIRSSKITPLGAEEMREKEAGVKSIFLLHCKGWEYSCLLLSTESSWRMSDVCAQQCKIRFCTSVHICMKPSKYTMQCVCQRYREKKEIAKKSVASRVQKFARDALIWRCCFLPLKRSNQSGFSSLSHAPRVNLLRVVWHRPAQREALKTFLFLTGSDRERARHPCALLSKN